MKNLFFCFAFGALLAACSPSPNLGSNTGMTGTASGTLGGKAFVPTTALAHAHVGLIDDSDTTGPAIDLVFSNAADLCTGMTNDQFVQGATYVTFYGIRAAVGTDATVTDAKFGVVADHCASGTRLDHDSGAVSAAAHVVAEGATVTFTRIDAERVEGTVSAKFEDLSTFEGSFSVVPCSGVGSDSFGNSPVCK